MLFLDGMKGVDNMEGNMEGSRADVIDDETGVEVPTEQSQPETGEDDMNDDEVLAAGAAMSALDFSMAMAQNQNQSTPNKVVIPMRRPLGLVNGNHSPSKVIIFNWMY